MIRRTGQVAALVIALVGFGGCGISAPRQSAMLLEQEISQYQQDQQSKIDSLNRQYRANYASLVSELSVREKEQRRLQFAEDSQRVADGLIAGWPKSTQPTQMHDVLAAVLNSHLS